MENMPVYERFMVLKAVLLDFNGVIINDESVHQDLIEQLLLEENLRLNPEEYEQACLGRSDRACFTELLSRRGRVVTEAYLDKLTERKTAKYQQMMASFEKLPVYSGLEDVVYQIRLHHLKLAIVSGACRKEIDWVLQQTQIQDHVAVVVSGDDVTASGSKPSPDGYQKAIEDLNHEFPDLDLTPTDCLAVEDSFAGIEAAKRAQVPVLGVAHTYPYHMVHRRADWAIDHLYELNLDWLKPYYSTDEKPLMSLS
jgi:HAD superfamily hydrolase (TIGR01509 family)